MKKRLKGGAKHMPNIKSAKKRVKVIENSNKLLKLEILKKLKHYSQKLQKKSIKLVQKVLLLKIQQLEKNLVYQKN